MKKFGFVIPWFGFDIPGGAESELKGIVTHLHKEGVEVEVLTTCVKEFTADWNENYYEPGEYTEKDILIRRFGVRKRNEQAFHEVNFKLMNKIMPSKKEEMVYIDEMINSPDLYAYISEHKDDYEAFVFIPYMFGTTYYGMKACIEKAVMIPCFHDESYVYMDIFKKLFSEAAGMIFLSKPEADLAKRLYGLKKTHAEVLGAGVTTEFTYDADRFREKFGIKEKFLLYAGRKDVGKNIYTLLSYFQKYREQHKESDMKLVLIGGGEVNVPKEIQDEVIDLGYVDLQDKYDAYAAAEMLCQPSHNESFSIVIMESWLCRRPVLVSDYCAVTKNFAKESNGGLYFKTYYEFEAEVDYILNHPEEAKIMGENGREYVLKNFSWDVFVKKFLNFFETMK